MDSYYRYHSTVRYIQHIFCLLGSSKPDPSPLPSRHPSRAFHRYPSRRLDDRGARARNNRVCCACRPSRRKEGGLPAQEVGAFSRARGRDQEESTSYRHMIRRLGGRWWRVLAARIRRPGAAARDAGWGGGGRLRGRGVPSVPSDKLVCVCWLPILPV